MEKMTPMSLRNRTGMQRSPVDAQQMLEVPERLVPKAKPDGVGARAVRGSYIAEADAIGSVPVPGTAKGMAKTGLQAMLGNRAPALMDKLGERLAFERAGVRLYDAAILKCEMLQTAGAQDAPIEGLRHIRGEEAAHAEMVVEAIQKLGGDPTAQTPAADLVGVEGMGLMQALGDPRTTLAQSLHVLLTAELTDNAGWELLITMMEDAKQPEIAQRFRVAKSHEAEHLARVQRWHTEAVMRETSMKEAMKAAKA